MQNRVHWKRSLNLCFEHHQLFIRAALDPLLLKASLNSVAFTQVISTSLLSFSSSMNLVFFRCISETRHRFNVFIIVVDEEIVSSIDSLKKEQGEFKGTITKAVEDGDIKGAATDNVCICKL